MKFLSMYKKILVYGVMAFVVGCITIANAGISNVGRVEASSGYGVLFRRYLPVSYFTEGTVIALPEGRKARIESLLIGDEVLTYDVSQKKQTTGVICDIRSSKMVEGYSLNDGELLVSGDDHLYVKKSDGEIGWGSINRDETSDIHPDSHLLGLEVGDSLWNQKKGWRRLETIDKLDLSFLVYSITVEEDHDFFANGILVHNDGCGGCTGCGGPDHARESCPDKGKKCRSDCSGHCESKCDVMGLCNCSGGGCSCNCSDCPCVSPSGSSWSSPDSGSKLAPSSAISWSSPTSWGEDQGNHNCSCKSCSGCSWSGTGRYRVYVDGSNVTGRCNERSGTSSDYYLTGTTCTLGSVPSSWYGQSKTFTLISSNGGCSDTGVTRTFYINTPPEVISANAVNTSCSSIWSGIYDNGANNPLELEVVYEDDDGAGDMNRLFVALAPDQSDDEGDYGCSAWERDLCDTMGIYYSITDHKFTITKWEKPVSGCPWNYGGDAENPRIKVEAVPPSTTQIDVYTYAKATGNCRLAGNVPKAEILINDKSVKIFDVELGNDRSDYKKYSYTYSGIATADDIKIRQANHCYLGPAHNSWLWVDKIVVNGITYESEDPSVRSYGKWYNNRCDPEPGHYLESEELNCGNAYFDYAGSERSPLRVQGNRITMALSVTLKDKFPTGRYKFFAMGRDRSMTYSCDSGGACWDEQSAWNVDLDLPETSLTIGHVAGDPADELIFEQDVEDDHSGIRRVYDRYYTVTSRSGDTRQCDIADGNCDLPDGDEIYFLLPPINTWSSDNTRSGFRGGDTVTGQIEAEDFACNSSDLTLSSPGTIGERWMKTLYGDVFSALGYSVPIQVSGTHFSTYLISSAQRESRWNFNVGDDSEKGWILGGYQDNNMDINWYDELYRLARKSDWVYENGIESLSGDDINISSIGGDGVYEHTGTSDVTIHGQCNGRHVIFIRNADVQVVPDIAVADDASACILVADQDVTIANGDNAGGAANEDVINMAFVVDAKFTVTLDQHFDGLRIKGLVIASETEFNRDLVYERNTDYPAETIEYDPRYLYLLKDMIGSRGFDDVKCGTVRGVDLCKDWPVE